MAATLDDTQIYGLIADALSTAILNTGGSYAFGYQLVVTGRDADYGAPNGWATDQPLAPEAETVIVSQAAIDYFFFQLRDMKISETTRDEGQEWQYTKSAQLLKDQLALLRDQRDRAIQVMQSLSVAMLDTYISLVGERDKLAAAWIEPWVQEIGAPVPYVQGADTGWIVDPRFYTQGGY